MGYKDALGQETRVVGISGFSGSGKDTVANYIRMILNSTSVSVADPIKRISAEAFGIPVPNLWDDSGFRNQVLPYDWDVFDSDKFEEGLERELGKYKTRFYKGRFFEAIHEFQEEHPEEFATRDLLIKLGNCGRDIDKEIWCDIAWHNINKLMAPSYSYSPVTGMTAFTLQRSVVVPDIRYQEEMAMVQEFKNHLLIYVRRDVEIGSDISEQSQLDFDMNKFHCILTNDSTKAELYNNVHMAIMNWVCPNG